MIKQLGGGNVTQYVSTKLFVTMIIYFEKNGSKSITDLLP